MAACETCGFDEGDYTGNDAPGTAKAIVPMLATMLEPIDDQLLARPEVGPLVTTIGDAAGDAGFDALHRAVHSLRQLSRVLHELGAGAPTQQGTVTQVNTSAGGVPKGAVPSIDIIRRGVVGDTQATRKHHGKPMQAVCVWSADVIDALIAEGHPIRPGAAGENITIAGVDWHTIRPGVRLLAGQSLLEVSAWAEPCRKNDRWFIGRSGRILHDTHPGWSRAYAWVLEGGSVRPGDTVIVEP